MRNTIRTTLIIAASLAGLAGLPTQALASGGDRSLKHQYASERDHYRHAQRGHRGNRDYNRHERRGHRSQRRQHNRYQNYGNHNGYYNRHYSGHYYDGGHWAYATHHRHHGYYRRHSYYGHDSSIYISPYGVGLYFN